MTDASMLKGAREALLEAKSAVDNIAKDFKVDEAGNFDLSKKQYGDYTAAVKRANEAKAFIDSVESMEQIGAYLDAPAGRSAAATDAGGAVTASEVKTLADVFMDSHEFKSAREKNDAFRTVGRIHSELEGKSLHSLSAGTIALPALGQSQDLGMVEANRRKTRIRDLFPKSTTRAAVLYSVVETGWVNNAQQVRQRYAADGTYGALDTVTDRTYTPGAGPNYTDLTGTPYAHLGGGPSGASGSEGNILGIDGTGDVYGKAPKSKIQMKPVTYPICTVAHTLDTHKNLLDDEPRLRTFLNHRMTEGVKFAEDFDLLHSIGGANTEELTGLFNVQGTQDFVGAASDKFSVQIRRAITKAQLAEYDPTGVVLSPEMWEQIEVEEDGYGGFRVAVNVSVGATKQVWHLNVVSTTAMADTNFIVASFGLGLQLHDREQVSVTMSTENNDNYERSVVTFRAEERIALEVPRPESIVIGTWTDYVKPA